MFKYLVKKLFWGLLRHLVSDKQYAQLRYWLQFDRFPDLEQPQSFTEKIQYIKLHERTELRKTFANRVKVRKYVADKIGGKYLIPLYGTFQELTKNNWDSLPRQFMLKANHGCDMLKVVKDKDQADFHSIKQVTEIWKGIEYYKVGREWVYKGLPRTILAEKLLLNAENEIPEDFKFFCFQGEVKIIQVDKDRFGEQKRNLYDRNFTRLDATLLYPNFEDSLEKPILLSQAIEIAEELSSEINFVRVDLYLMDQQIYFGELTNYPGNGFVAFKPPSMERKAGQYLRL
jgi:hypothetical protein